MPRTSKLLTAVGVAACFVLRYIGGATAAKSGWNIVTMINGVELSYPSTWWPISVSKDRLDILSSKGGATGVVIRHGQAQIIVAISERSTSTSFDQFASEVSQGQTFLSSEELAPSVKDGCSRIRRVTSTEEAAPDFYVTDTAIFCEISDDRAVFVLRNWRRDPQQRQYQRIELQMARGLRARQNK